VFWGAFHGDWFVYLYALPGLLYPTADDVGVGYSNLECLHELVSEALWHRGGLGQDQIAQL
jgi:hypothetical protein